MTIVRTTVRGGVLVFSIAFVGLLSAPDAAADRQAPSVDASRPTPQVPRLERVREWLAAVEHHEPGTTDDAAMKVGSWSSSQLRLLWIDVNTVVTLMRQPGANAFDLKSDDRRSSRRITYGPRELQQLRELARAAIRPDDANHLVKRGALLHADIAMLVEPEREPLASMPFLGFQRIGGPQRFVMQTADGHQVGLEQNVIHWELARTLLDAVAPRPSRDEMVRLWYRATMAYMQSRDELDLVHHERARELFPADAEVLLSNGSLHETFAAPVTQSAIQSAALPTGFKVDVASEHGELRQAESFLRRSLDADPALTEARVRLGRVLARLGRHADAVVELQRAVADTRDPLIEYYGELFLGGEEEALGHRDLARAAYERAAALYPQAQSPRLALSQLARRYGDRPAALRAIQQVLNLPANERERLDPWWNYHIARGRNADALFAELRAPFLAAPKK